MPTDYPIYSPECPISTMLQLLSKRWVFFILRAIQHDMHSFSGIKRALGGKISNRILTDRLHELMQVGILEQRQSSGKMLYHFTTRGTSAIPMIEGACLWAATWEGLPYPMSTNTK